MKNVMIGVVVAGFLVGCGGDGSSSSGGGGGREKNVTFTLNPQSGPQCTNADDFDRFTGQTFTSVDCIWLCGNYKGQKRRYVSIDFQRRNRPGEVWEINNEYISGGICRD